VEEIVADEHLRATTAAPTGADQEPQSSTA
jgi:hypothetical protein